MRSTYVSQWAQSGACVAPGGTTTEWLTERDLALVCPPGLGHASLDAISVHLRPAALIESLLVLIRSTHSF